MSVNFVLCVHYVFVRTCLDWLKCSDPNQTFGVFERGIRVNNLGWSLDRTPADTLKKTIPELYDAETLSGQTYEATPDAIVYNNMPPRYAVWCRPEADKLRQDFREHYAHPEDQREYRTW